MPVGDRRRYADDPRARRPHARRRVDDARGQCPARFPRRRRLPPHEQSADRRRCAGARRRADRRRSSTRPSGMPFWDAPLDLNPPPSGRGRQSAAGDGRGEPARPAAQAREIKRAAAVYRRPIAASVKTNGARIEISFPGVPLGVFERRAAVHDLQRQQPDSSRRWSPRPSEPSVAYKYDAGLKGLRSRTTRAWCGATRRARWQDYRFGGAENEREMPLKTANRLLVAERGAAPDRSRCFRRRTPSSGRARSRSTSATTGIARTATRRSRSASARPSDEDDAEDPGELRALQRAARHAGSTCRCSSSRAPTPRRRRCDAALAFTHGDRYKPLPGYQVMNHHYHMDLGQRLLARRQPRRRDPRSAVALRRSASTSSARSIRSANAATAAARPRRWRSAAASIEGARRHSDRDFLVMPNQEFYGSPLGGHTDLLFSHPVYWTQGRAAGQPLVEQTTPSTARSITSAAPTI